MIDPSKLADKIERILILVYLEDEQCWRDLPREERAAIVEALRKAAGERR